MDTLNQKRVWSGLGSVLFVSLLACLFTACNDKIDVQQAFPFTVETMPVPTRLVLGETAEIRCELGVSRMHATPYAIFSRTGKARCFWITA